MSKQQQPTETTRVFSSAERRKRVIPLSFQLAGPVLNLVSRIHNEWASDLLAGLWFRVFKTPNRPWVAEFWASADERIEIQVEDSKIPVYCWGQGPLVVTMHGWSGSGTQFRFFIKPLVAAGFRVACFDAPAHGDNPGRQAHLMLFSESLIAVQKALGEIDTLIAHSLGSMAVAYAIQQGLSSNRMVLVAPQLDVQEMFESYRDLLCMRRPLAQRFQDKIGARMKIILQDRDPWEILQPPTLLADESLRGLLVYDHEDPEVPQHQIDEIILHWKNCEILSTRGVGHNRILRDEATIAGIVQHLA